MTDIGGSAVEASESARADPDLPHVAGFRVLRLCSVFEPATLSPGAARYDAIGGMQNHTAELTRCLDRMGVRQLVLTSRLDGPPGRAGFGRYGQVVRTGLRTPLVRQAWAPQAARLVASRVGGIPALVDHDVNGLLAPPGDAAALAGAITRVLTEPDTAARLSAAARRTAERYAWPALARQVVSLYQEVTAKPA